MHIAFKFTYLHNNGLFTRLLQRVNELSPLKTTLYKEDMDYILATSGEQSELESLAELVSQLIPQSLFLSSYSIEAIESIDTSKLLEEEEYPYGVAYCNECQHEIMQTLNPFLDCKVCGYSDTKLSFEEVRDYAKVEANSSEELFEVLAEKLVESGRLSLPTYKGIRHFSLLREVEDKHSGILICDPSEISTSFVITQEELNALMMIEKPSVRLKPKIRFRAEFELQKPLYSLFLADDKVALALSLALSRKGVFALYCDQPPVLRVASALGEHAIIRLGGDMLPWHDEMKLEHPSCCHFDGFSAYGDTNGLLVDKVFQPTRPCVEFIPKGSLSKGVSFEPSHAALRSVVLEHDLQGKSLCGIYLSREHAASICSFSSKIGYTSLATFSYEIPHTPKEMLESIAQMDEAGKKLVSNYKKAYPRLCEQIEAAQFSSDSKLSMLSKLWAVAAFFIGLVDGGDMSTACEELEAAALEFTGKSGPRIDYKVMKSAQGYEVDPRLAIRSAMSFKLAGVDEYLLSFGFIDSLADFIAQQAELADANIAIEGVSLNGSLFENRQLLMRTYNALSRNYTIYRNRRLSLDSANIAIGAITLGSE